VAPPGRELSRLRRFRRRPACRALAWKRCCAHEAVRTRGASPPSETRAGAESGLCPGTFS
jgi:hypothetical protein